MMSPVYVPAEPSFRSHGSTTKYRGKVLWLLSVYFNTVSVFNLKMWVPLHKSVYHEDPKLPDSFPPMRCPSEEFTNKAWFIKAFRHIVRESTHIGVF